MGTYKLKKTLDNQYMFNLHAVNGEIILTSERYTTKASAQLGIESVKTNSPFDSRYGRLTSSNGQPYFTLNAANGQTIGRSELYSSSQERDAGIASVKANGPTSGTVDET